MMEYLEVEKESIYLINRDLCARKSRKRRGEKVFGSNLGYKVRESPLVQEGSSYNAKEELVRYVLRSN